jgi:hypothetical protein
MVKSDMPLIYPSEGAGLYLAPWQSKIHVDLVVRVTLVQRLGLSGADTVMQTGRVRTVGADAARHAGPLACLEDYYIFKSIFNKNNDVKNKK